MGCAGPLLMLVREGGSLFHGRAAYAFAAFRLPAELPQLLMLKQAERALNPLNNWLACHTTPPRGRVAAPTPKLTDLKVASAVDDDRAGKVQPRDSESHLSKVRSATS